MATTPTLIYCAGGNKRLAQIAIDAGFEYGARLPDTVYFPLYFADNDWKKPNRAAYMAGLARHRPHMATVLDYEREGQLGEVLDWAEQAAQYVERVLIVPKVFSSIGELPGQIGGKEVVLAYSVPSKYGGTQVPVWEFAGRLIHLLGGSPKAQINAYLHLHNVADVVSADGNYAQKMAVQYCRFYSHSKVMHARNPNWPLLKEVGGFVDNDAPYEAFACSCRNIKAAWAQVTSPHNTHIAGVAKEG